MIGPLLNILNTTYNKIDSLSKNEPFTPTSNIFGTGTIDVEITGTKTIKDLYEQYHTLEFHNVTIREGAKLKPFRTNGGLNGWESTRNPFHPLFLKCSGTLMVDGELTSQGCGGASSYYNGDANCFQNDIRSPVSIYYFGEKGASADTQAVNKLIEYGKNGDFFLFKDFFLVGAGGGGRHRWRSGKWGRHHERDVTMRGFANGGGFGGTTNRIYGCAGGFVGLYFNSLSIKGIEYGSVGCDVTKISANGYQDGNFGMFGGGCMVIAARKIRIGANGTINSDGDGGHKFIVNTLLGTSYEAGRGSGSNFKPSFLNNYPAMSGGQWGYHWDYNNKRYVGDTNHNGTYYFDDGSGLGTPTAFVSGYSLSEGCGGAGLAIGYKIIDKYIQSIDTIVPEKTSVTYYGWKGFNVPYYAWRGTYNVVYDPGTERQHTETETHYVYTSTEHPTAGDFIVHTVPIQVYNQIQSVSEEDGYIVLRTSYSGNIQFTRDYSADTGEGVFYRYLKDRTPVIDSTIYDSPNNFVSGKVTGIVGNCIYDEFGRLLYRAQDKDQYVTE